MTKIHVMDPILANKIAAGEVVERPASVVKELVENAIDAGSTEIEIHLIDSGIKSITVIDNGEGMSKDDANLAFLRHATSKIQNDFDLFNIQSLGFRGEALPAIASVSKVTVKTAQKGNDIGVEIQIEGGKKIAETAAAFSGTYMNVSDLFYNTPARLNYLKSLQAELSQITDFIQKIALAYPNISFSYTNNDLQLLHTPGNGDIATILSKIFGVTIGKALTHFEAHNSDFKIEGYFAAPQHQRYNRNGIYLIVNGRIIRNYVLSKAVVDAFHTYMPVDRFPICYLNIKLDPMLIDVNVHPTKQEVKITSERQLAELITDTIRQTLIQSTKPADLSTLFEVFTETAQNTENQATHFSTNNESLNQRNTYHSETLSEKEKESVTLLFNDFIKDKPMMNDENREPTPIINTAVIDFSNENRYTEKYQQSIDDISGENTQTLTNEKLIRKIPLIDIIGQYNGTYIIGQNSDGLYFVDQHAAAERIKYEKYLSYMSQSKFDLQQLVTPVIVDISRSEAQQIELYEMQLKQIGVQIRLFSEISVAIDELPTWIPNNKLDQYVRMLIDFTTLEGEVKREKIIEAAAIMLSCKLSIKANHALTQYEMQSLLDQLNMCENPFTCPHGRPTIILKRLYELEKWFKRV